MLLPTPPNINSSTYIWMQSFLPLPGFCCICNCHLSFSVSFLLSVTSYLQTYKNLFILTQQNNHQQMTLAIHLASPHFSTFSSSSPSATSAPLQATPFWGLPHGPHTYTETTLPSVTQHFLTVKPHGLSHFTVHNLQWQPKLENSPLFRGCPARHTCHAHSSALSALPPHYPSSPTSFSGSSKCCFAFLLESNAFLLDLSLSLSIGVTQHRPQISLKIPSPKVDSLYLGFESHLPSQLWVPSSFPES